MQTSDFRYTRFVTKNVLRLRGRTVVYIDWANVYGWTSSLHRVVDVKKLNRYLRQYHEIKATRFYFGTDTNRQSKTFLKSVKTLGYSVTTKPVKYITVGSVEEKLLKRRKCDFDIEICIDVHKDIAEGVESFVFFSGDGDFEPLYRLLIEQRRQVIVVYAKNHIGREIWNLKKGIFKIQVTHLGL